MRAAVVVFPGSNADTEMLRALRDVAGLSVDVVWHTERVLPPATELVALPGGFAFGDYLRAGAIAKTSPVLAAVRAHAARGGLVLGVCNGFQILTEAGLLPGALARNASARFESRDAFVRVEPGARAVTTANAFTGGLPNVLRLPVAHGEGRYVASDATLDALERDGAIALRYCDARGELAEAANFNGSARAIAGLFGGPARNVLGLMPHVERRCEPLHGGEDGQLVFASIAAAVARSAA